MKALIQQCRIELLMTLRRGESLLVTLGIPIGLLLFFTNVDLLSIPEPRAGALAPGIAAVAIMASAMVSLGIATGFERNYLVLKRLGGTPLGRGRLLAAKMLALLLMECIQTAAIVGTASASGADLDMHAATVLIAVILGTCCFAGIGLLMAGTLKAELNLAASNALFLALLLLGGALVPMSALPSAIAAPAKLLPLYPLAKVFGAGLTGSAVDGGAWAVLLGWGIIAPALAVLTFSWEPKS